MELCKCQKMRNKFSAQKSFTTSFNRKNIYSPALLFATQTLAEARKVEDFNREILRRQIEPIQILLWKDSSNDEKHEMSIV